MIYTVATVTIIMNTISSLKEKAIACAPLRNEQVEVVNNVLLEFFLLATGKAGLPLPIFDHLSGLKKTPCIVT